MHITSSRVEDPLMYSSITSIAFLRYWPSSGFLGMRCSCFKTDQCTTIRGVCGSKASEAATLSLSHIALSYTRLASGG
eukprot:1122533-Amphidinium_carterae.1